MFRSKVFLIFGALCCLVVFGHGESTVTPKPQPPEPAIEDSSTVAPIVTDSPAPSTDPPTTTPTPPTPPSPPTPAPGPAPKPGPVPPPDQGTWSFTQDNVTCIVVQFAAQLNVTYTKANTTSDVQVVLLNVPVNASVSGGNCTGNGTQWLTINWKVENTSVSNNLTFVFERNDTTKNYALKQLNMSLTAELFPNSSYKNDIEATHGAEWMTPLATSYRCTTATPLTMATETTSVAAKVTFSQLQEEAFRTSSGKGFSAARECGSGDVPDAVPIAVGCALGGLVVVVLIAYLVGRRRSAARGYLSM